MKRFIAIAAVATVPTVTTASTSMDKVVEVFQNTEVEVIDDRAYGYPAVSLVQAEQALLKAEQDGLLQPIDVNLWEVIAPPGHELGMDNFKVWMGNPTEDQPCENTWRWSCIGFSYDW